MRRRYVDINEHPHKLAAYADLYTRLKNDSPWTNFCNLLGISEDIVQKRHADSSSSHLGNRVIRNDGMSIALFRHFEDSTPERFESSTASWVDPGRLENLGNARFERAAFGSGGRRRCVPHTPAMEGSPVSPVGSALLVDCVTSCLDS